MEILAIIILTPIAILNLAAWIRHRRERKEARRIIANRMNEMIEESEKGRN